MKFSIFSLIILLMLLLTAGCSQYAEPELSLSPNIIEISSSDADLSITYDIELTIQNTGSNNAYDVTVLFILSTPKDLPEYRFTSTTAEVGTVEKKGEVKIKRQMTLPMTKENYDLIKSGERTAEIETKIMHMTSNIMG